MEMELHKMCRICLKNDLLVSIYSPTFLMRPADIIEKLHIFKLNEDDLPKMLCQSCLYRLLDAYNLQQLAETSERRLREFFGTCVNGGSENLLGITNNNHEIEVVRNENGMGMESTVTGTGCGCGSGNGNGSENGSKSSSNAELRDMHSTLLLTSTTTTTSSSAAAALSSGNNQQLFGHYCDDIAVKDATDDLINDVEIDVSSLTRSEPDDEDDEEDEEEEEEEEEEDTSMSEVFVNEQSNLLDVLNLHTEDKINLEKSTNKKGTSKKQLKTPEKCLECGKLFKYSGYLAVHKRTHTGEKPYKCKLCPRTFTQSSNLLLHERTHTGERRYQCELCANLFTTSSNLKTHRLTHTEQRDFKCTHCTLSFKTLRALRRHEPKHKTHKDIACTLCDKAFVKHCYLNTHMATVHRGIKRHKCHECHKYFGNRSNLLCHLRVHTGERPFQCKLCAWKFNQSSALARHMKKHFKSATKFNPEQVGNDHQLTNNYDFTTSVILDFSINNNKYD